MDRPGSITATMIHDGEPIPGGTLTLYRVGDVQEEDGNFSFRLSEDFAGSEASLETLNAALAEALMTYARNEDPEGTTADIDREGRVEFPGLKAGLYLLVQEKPASGYKKVNPFLVSVPYNDNGHYIYDVDTAPKNLPGMETEPTTQPTKPGGKLPQTGQTNWPVPVMATVGMLLVMGGLCLKASARKKTYEE